jgi:hypothetical protein
VLTSPISMPHSGHFPGLSAATQNMGQAYFGACAVGAEGWGEAFGFFEKAKAWAENASRKIKRKLRKVFMKEL